MANSLYYSTILSSPLFAAHNGGQQVDLAVGTECIDMRFHTRQMFNGSEASMKPYPTLGGLLIPYVAGENNTVASNVVTGMELFPKIRGFFNMGHTDCGAMKRLKSFLLGEQNPGQVTGGFYNDLMPRTDEFYNSLEDALKYAKSRNDKPADVLRELTELMILKSTRNFLAYPSDEIGHTIADKVNATSENGEHSFDVMPAIYDMESGRPLIYAFDKREFVRIDEAGVNWQERIGSEAKRSDAISDALRRGKIERVERIAHGNYERAGR